MYISRVPLKIVAIASVVVAGACVVAWIAAVRLPYFNNYWEWHDGWHVGLRTSSGYDAPVWYDTYIFFGQFSDRGIMPTPTDDDVDPYPGRWPSLNEKAVSIPSLLLVSLLAPAVWLILRFRTVERRGFPLDT